MSHEDDGIALYSTAHPIAPWHERIYWRLIRIRNWFRDLHPSWRPYEDVEVEFYWCDGKLHMRVVPSGE